MEQIDTGKKWYKWVHIKNDTKDQYIFMIEFHDCLTKQDLKIIGIEILKYKNYAQIRGRWIKVSDMYTLVDS